MLARETIGAMEDKARALEAMDHDGLPSCAGTIVLRLGYSGEAYSGFAEQTQPEVRTVAGEIAQEGAGNVPAP